MAEPSADAVALVKKLHDAKSVDEQRSALRILRRPAYGTKEGRALVDAGAVPVIVKLFMECDDDELKADCAVVIGHLAFSQKNIGTLDSDFLETMVRFLSYVDEDGHNSAAFALYWLTTEDQTTRQSLRDIPNVCDAIQTSKEMCEGNIFDDLLDFLLPLSTSGKRIKPARA